MDITAIDLLAAGRVTDTDTILHLARKDGIRMGVYGSDGTRRRYVNEIDGVKSFQETYRRLSGGPCPKVRSDAFRQEIIDIKKAIEDRKNERMRLGIFGKCIPVLNNRNPWYQMTDYQMTDTEREAVEAQNQESYRKLEKLTLSIFTRALRESMAGGPNEGVPVTVRITSSGSRVFGWVHTAVRNAKEADIRKYGIEVSLDDCWAVHIARSIGPTFLGMPIGQGPSSGHEPIIELLNTKRRWTSESDLLTVVSFRHVVDIRADASARTYKVLQAG